MADVNTDDVDRLDLDAEEVGHTFCPKCKTRYLYNDDPHNECMRCRGRQHSCEMCPDMGNKCKERYNIWIAQQTSVTTVPSLGIGTTGNVTNSGKVKPSHTVTSQASGEENVGSKSQNVTFEDLRSFGEDLTGKMTSLISRLLSNVPPVGNGEPEERQRSPVRPVVRSVQPPRVRDESPNDRQPPPLEIEVDGQSEVWSEDLEDARSMVSSWDYKRGNDKDD